MKRIPFILPLYTKGGKGYCDTLHKYFDNFMSFSAKRNRTIAAMRSLGEFDVGEGGRKVPWPLQHNEAVPPSAAPPSVNDAALRGFFKSN